MLRPVLVVEDDRKISRVVALYLEEAGYRVVQADTGRKAVDAATADLPLLVVLDLGLPDVGGEQVIQELKALGDVPVIILTSRSSEEDRVVGFALGADDYVVKPFSPRELVSRVKAVLKRAHRGDLSEGQAASFEKGLLVLDGHRYEARHGGEPVSLTPAEFKVLFALASSAGRVMTRAELVDKALGYQFEGYERSIDAHIKNIRQKLKDDPRKPSFILTVYGLHPLGSWLPPLAARPSGLGGSCRWRQAWRVHLVVDQVHLRSCGTRDAETACLQACYRSESNAARAVRIHASALYSSRRP